MPPCAACACLSSFTPFLGHQSSLAGGPVFGVHYTAWGQTSFAGTWDTTFGPVILTQKDSKVSGTYYAGQATLQGTVEKKKLTFTYNEPGEAGEGWFELSA